MSYQRDILQAGLFSIGDASLNRRGLDGNIVVKTLQGMELPEGQQFYSVKRQLLTNYSKMLAIARTSEVNTEIFHSSLKRSLFGIMDPRVEIDDRQILDLIEDNPREKKNYSYLEDMDIRIAESRSDLS